MRREVVGIEDARPGPASPGPSPAGLGGEGEQQAGDQQDRSRVDRARVAHQRLDDERQAAAGEQHRRRVGDGAARPGQPDLEAGPAEPSVPARVEDEPQVEGRREQSEADQVEMALLELARRPDARRRPCAQPASAPSGACGSGLAWTCALRAQNWLGCHLADPFDAAPPSPARSVPGGPGMHGRVHNRGEPRDL